MCTIIQFPIKESAGYQNLKALFEICDSVESCNFYLECVESLAESGDITEKEMYALRRIGRTKRLDLANPKQKAQEVAANGEYQYTPEMGEQKPDCQIEAQLGYYGEHYYLKTALELKGRGIVREQDAENGKHWYRVTTRAYENLKQIYTISRVMYLD